jgi:hypothetical protein
MALPAPMSEKDLNDKSDLVAVVRVLSVTLTTITKDEKTGEELPGYMAQLRLLDVKKGDVVLVTWRAVPSKIVGPWAVYYYPGEEVLTHLTKRDGGVAYASTWWNAKGDDITKPESTELPKQPGQTVVPRGTKQDQVPL